MPVLSNNTYNTTFMFFNAQIHDLSEQLENSVINYLQVLSLKTMEIRRNNPIHAFTISVTSLET